MKNTIFLILVLVSFSLFAHSNGPVYTVGLASTGAPGESTCGSCHSGGAVNGDIAFKDLSAHDLFQSGYYTPGQQYFISCYILSTVPFPNGGIQFRAVDANNNPKGWFLPGNTSNANQAPVRLKSINGQWCQFIEQPAPITPSMVNGSYRIQIVSAWRPGAFDNVPIYFYGSGTLTNNNDSITGDQSFSIYHIVYPQPPLDLFTDTIRSFEQRIVVDLGILAQPKMFSFGDEDIISFRYYSYQGDKYRYRLYDSSGKLVQKGDRSVPEGAGEERIRLEPLPEGYYIFRIITGRGGVYTGKILK